MIRFSVQIVAITENKTKKNISFILQITSSHTLNTYIQMKDEERKKIVTNSIISD